MSGSDVNPNVPERLEAAIVARGTVIWGPDQAEARPGERVQLAPDEVAALRSSGVLFNADGSQTGAASRIIRPIVTDSGNPAQIGLQVSTRDLAPWATEPSDDGQPPEAKENADAE